MATEVIVPDERAKDGAEESAPPRPSPVGGAALWTAILGGPIAWMIQLNVAYPLASESCADAWPRVPMYATNVVTLLLAAATVALAWRNWSRLGGGAGELPGDEPDAIDRARFMALLGLVTSASFVMVIVAESVPFFFLGPCVR